MPERDFCLYNSLFKGPLPFDLCLKDENTELFNQLMNEWLDEFLLFSLFDFTINSAVNVPQITSKQNTEL